MVTDLSTTNVFLGIMAAVSVLQAVAIIGMSSLVRSSFAGSCTS